MKILLFMIYSRYQANYNYKVFKQWETVSELLTSNRRRGQHRTSNSTICQRWTQLMPPITVAGLPGRLRIELKKLLSLLKRDLSNWKNSVKIIIFWSMLSDHRQPESLLVKNYSKKKIKQWFSKKMASKKSRQPWNKINNSIFVFVVYATPRTSLLHSDAAIARASHAQL